MNNILESCLLMRVIQTYHVYSHDAQRYIRYVISESECAYDSITKIFFPMQRNTNFQLAAGTWKSSQGSA